jgi:enoyl-[acyl-carrier-protein] reductase (NADH)
LTQTNVNPNNQYSKIFAGCFNPKQAKQDLVERLGKELVEQFLVIVPLDVTNDKSVQQAAALIETSTAKDDIGLTAFVCFHGVAYEGPVQYSKYILTCKCSRERAIEDV